MDQSDLRFEVKTGVRQGYVISAILFNTVIDWVLRRTTEDEPRGTRWTLFSTLEDVDFAEDPALLPRAHRHIQAKTARLSTFGQQVGLNISRKKTEMMTVGIPSASPVKVGQSEPTSVETFTYLGSTISQGGGTSNDTRNPLNKALNVFMTMEAAWIEVRPITARTRSS